MQMREGTTRAQGDGLEEVGLFDTVAVYFVEGQRGRGGASIYKWYLGRVQKVYKLYPGGRKVDYVLPVRN